MQMQGGPSASPPPVGPAGMPLASGPPLVQLVGAIQPTARKLAAQTGAPLEVVTGFLIHVLDQVGPQQAVMAMRQLMADEQQFVQDLVAFTHSPAGATLIPQVAAILQRLGPQGAPGPQTMPPPGPPGSAPPPGGGAPPSPPGAGGPPPQGGPPPIQGPQRLGGGPRLTRPSGPPKPPKVKKPAAPSWDVEELPKNPWASRKGPTHAQVVALALEGRTFYRELTLAMQEWRDLYMQWEDPATLTGVPANQYQGQKAMPRAQQTLLADRYVGITAPSLDRLGIQADPWDDSDEGREAAQVKENFCRYSLEEIERKWNRRAESGDMQPPLDRKVAGLAVIEGGYGWRVMPDMEADPDRTFPWSVEPVPFMELYSRPRGTTRQVDCTLGEAWAYPEVQKLLPELPEGTNDPAYNDQARVRLITFSDEVWWCLALEFHDPAIPEKIRQRGNKREFWVYPPVEHKLGRRIFVFENPWNSTSLGPSAGDKVPRARSLVRGVYSPIVGQIKFINQLMIAIRAGVFKDLHPPMKAKLDPLMRAQHPGVFQGDPATMIQQQANSPGGVVPLGPNEDVEKIVDALAASPNAQFLLQSAMSDLGDVQPPVLSGRGQAQSGFDRFQASESAGALHVDPLQAYHIRQYQRVLEAILTDLVRLMDGDKPAWTKLPYKMARSRSKGGPYRTTLTAKDIKRAGPYVTITYKRLSMTERMQMAQLNMLLVKEHMKSRLSAMDELGIDDTEREQARMFAEAALESPSVVKAAIRTALGQQAAEEDQNPDGDINWAAVMYRAAEEEMAREQQQPAEKGMPSPNGAPPGPGGPPPMPGSPAPGLPPTMTGG